jgi:DNA-binding transcriptional LysR family regulator
MYEDMKISLEQWEAFVTVVNEGSFARAAEALNKSQSSVSYTIAQMEQRLPTPVFRQQGRKAELTEAGKVLFRQAQGLLTRAADLEESAAYLASGWEAEITLAVDAVFPTEPLYCALQEFSSQSPLTRIRILETTLSGTEEALLLRQADIVLAGRVPPGFLGRQIAFATMTPVASPSHPLLTNSSNDGREVTEDELRTHRQIVIRDSGIKREQDAGWLGSEQRWTVSHLSTSVEIVSKGLGFAFLPEEKIGKEILSGKLAVIPLAAGYHRQFPLHLVLSAQHSAGPGAEALAVLIKQAYLQAESERKSGV